MPSLRLPNLPVCGIGGDLVRFDQKLKVSDSIGGPFRFQAAKGVQPDRLPGGVMPIDRRVWFRAHGSEVRSFGRAGPPRRVGFSRKLLFS